MEGFVKGAQKVENNQIFVPEMRFSELPVSHGLVCPL